MNQIRVKGTGLNPTIYDNGVIMSFVHPLWYFMLSQVNSSGTFWSDPYTDQFECFDTASKIEDEKKLAAKTKKKGK